jgi:hypothetical protein
MNAQIGGYMTRSNGVNAEQMNRERRKSYPGPGHYGEVGSSITDTAGGRISSSINTTDLALHMRVQAAIPGPGQYVLPRIERFRAVKEPMAGRFGAHSQKCPL